MSEGLKPVLPLRLGALLSISPSVHVLVSARADALQMSAPFGELTIPYSLVTRSLRNANSGITLHFGGTIMTLDLGAIPDIAVNALLDLIEEA